METKYLELIVEAHAGVDLDQLRFRLQHENVETLPMQSGLLISGDISALRAVIPNVTGNEPGEVAVPTYLNDVVKTIYVVKPRWLT